MLGNRLAGYGQSLAQLAQRLAVLRVQAVQQEPAASIRQRPEDGIIVHGTNTQPFGCMSSADLERPDGGLSFSVNPARAIDAPGKPHVRPEGFDRWPSVERGRRLWDLALG